MKGTFDHASDDFKKLNPHLFVGGLVANSAKRDALQTLDSSVPISAGGAGRVEIRVVIVAYRRRLLDAHDAIAYAAKPITDAIAESLGMDDADPRIIWEYHQIKTNGEQGVTVSIQCLLAV